MTILPSALLRQLDRPGPRYTSYPTADRFHEGVSPEDYAQALRRRGQDTDAPPLSVYVHVPFCASVCYYCACHKIVTRHHDRAAPYLQMLRREIALHREALGLLDVWSREEHGRSLCTARHWVVRWRCRSCTWGAVRPPS